MRVEAKFGSPDDKFSINVGKATVRRVLRIGRIGKGDVYETYEDAKPGLSFEEMADDIVKNGPINVLYVSSFYEVKGVVAVKGEKPLKAAISFHLPHFGQYPYAFIDGLVLTREEVLAKFQTGRALEDQIYENTVQWVVDRNIPMIVRPRAQLWHSRSQWFKFGDNDILVSSGVEEVKQ